MMRHTFAAVIQWQACHGERCGNGRVGALAMLTWHNQVLEGTQATPVTLNTAQVAGKGRDSCGTRGSHVNNNAFTCRLFKTHPMCVTYRCSVWTRIFDVPDKRVVLTPHCSRVLHHGPNPPRARDGPEGHDRLTCAPCKNDAYYRGIASRTMTPRTPQIAFSSVGHHASPTPAPNFFGSSRGRSVLRSFGHRVPFSIDQLTPTPPLCRGGARLTVQKKARATRM